MASEDSLSVDDEILNYLKMNTKVSENSCPLAFYKNNLCQFPVLSKIAKMLFCITASSTPSEDLFSSAGKLLRRNRLTRFSWKMCLVKPRHIKCPSEFMKNIFLTVKPLTCITPSK